MPVVDSKALEILMEDARITAEEIASRLGVSVDEVRQEIQSLEDEKIIVGYQPVLNPNKAYGDRVTSLIEVRVQPERGKGYDKTAERIARYPEVRTLFLVSGSYDFLVVVEGASIQEVSYFVMEKLATLDQVVSTTTHFLLKTFKQLGTSLVEEEENHRLPITM
jgi:DNA-binding Lrp family transcriptional regulator